MDNLKFNKLSNKVYTCEGVTGNTHRLNLKGSIASCSCRDFKIAKNCIHITGLKELLKEQGIKVRLAPKAADPFTYRVKYEESIKNKLGIDLDV